MNAVTDTYRRLRADGHTASVALTIARGEHRPPAYPWLDKLDQWSQASGTVGPFRVEVQVEPDIDSQLGDDDVTGVFTDDWSEGCVPTDRRRGGSYKWYRPSNYTLNHAREDLRRQGLSRGDVEIGYRRRVLEEMADDAERCWWTVVVTVKVEGVHLATAAIGGIDETPAFDARLYLREVAEEQIAEAIETARLEIPAAIRRLSVAAAEMHRAAAPTVSLVKTVGYVCKRCGGPSPVGVGYVDSTPGAAEASQGRTACPCGYSRLP